MTLRNIERHFDRIVPAFLVGLTMIAAIGTAGLGV